MRNVAYKLALRKVLISSNIGNLYDVISLTEWLESIR